MIDHNSKRILRLLSNQSKSRGFTLLELLITVIIVGVLAAIAIPSLVGQVARSRETEAMTTIGALNRAQVAYRYEYGTFALIGETAGTIVIQPSQLEVPITSKYYSYRDIPLPGTDEERAKYGATALPEYTNSLKNYSGGIRYIASTNTFNTVLCRGNDHTEDNINNIRPILNIGSGGWTCFGNSTELK
ncbi:probable general secretion pathway protein G [Crocosphaera subtropica ATCC 51142]|uniref:Probable general secretion pathway protein G n=1 Tax=Crocosphaera subtropica (strain ATCC 51142 / BH68) TaxID=43989 RepID=B1WPM0_CROS5|nr:type IV pilin-like G/H family protein [Crocosphaera subtropica]ACB51590.1 probable general secretion pathway protein G [Crocosphaera subtropica ATCC 51142]